MEQPVGVYERIALPISKASAWIWRFRTLAFAEGVFRRYTSPHILKRPFFGYTLHLDVSRSSAQRQLYLVGERFMSEAALIKSLMDPGATVVDVGANIGYYVLLAARCVGPSGHIVAFEPEPDNLVELRMNVEANQLNNIEVHPFAVGARKAEVLFARGINGGVRDSAATNEVSVPLVTLDDALNRRVDMVKIDVEGYEGEVLAGAESTIKRWQPNLFVEIHPRMMQAGHSALGVLDFLHRHYPDVRLYEPSRKQGFAQKFSERYLGRGVSPIAEGDAAKSCRQGTQDTFWAVCRRGPT